MAPRLDRLLTLFLFGLSNLFPYKRKKNAAILMYHDVSNTIEDGINPYFRISTTPAAFDKQIEFLHKEGYETCTPGDLLSGLDRSSETGTKKISITFDDGFLSVYQNAFPILVKYNYTATIYLPSDLIGAEDRKNFEGKPCMNWEEVREMAEAGFTFGSHTASHAELIKQSENEISEELKRSKNRIEQMLSIPVVSFSFPYAFPEMKKGFVHNFRRFLENNGYCDAVTTMIGTIKSGADPYRLKRIPVNSCDDIGLLKAKVTGSYDWLYGFQKTVKMFKKCFPHDMG